jgi:hypothetical protein
MAYENVQQEAVNGLKGVRKPPPIQLGHESNAPSFKEKE